MCFGGLMEKHKLFLIVHWFKSILACVAANAVYLFSLVRCVFVVIFNVAAGYGNTAVVVVAHDDWHCCCSSCWGCCCWC